MESMPERESAAQDGTKQRSVTKIEIPMAVEKAWHLIQSELPVSSWAKAGSAHEFSLIDDTGHFAFSLVPSGHHECWVFYRTDRGYSETLVQQTTDVLATEVDDE